MKALFYAILALLSLLLEVNQTEASHPSAVINQSDQPIMFAAASITEATANHEADRSVNADTSLLIGNVLERSLIRKQLTITQSSQDYSVKIEDFDGNYGKKIQDFAATLDDGRAEFSINKKSQKRNPLLGILIAFLIEIVITLIVLRITFLLADFRYHLTQMLPISLAVGFVGILLRITLGISLLNPIQIALSSLIMLMMIRIITEAHDWADALQITVVTRIVTIGLTWLAFVGMSVFGIYI